MEYYVGTNVGVVRSENQDRAAFVKGNNASLAILCDGMGGHEGGSHASRIAIETFETAFLKKLPKKEEDFGSWFTDTLKKSKKNMEKYAGKETSLLDMGTTVTAAIIAENKIFVFNVGDSRTYIYNGLFHQITVDHNLRNHYINKFGYSEEEAATVVGAAALTSALGPKKKIFAEQFLVERDSTTEFLVLTSDGIHDYIAKPNFESILKNDSSLEEKSSMLISAGIKGKSSDNLTTVIVRLK